LLSIERQLEVATKVSYFKTAKPFKFKQENERAVIILQILKTLFKS
jgi:hypothetical protein